MKRFFSFILILSFFVFQSCKKDSVDATNTQSLESSINDMASGLPTLRQVKFNEALYILKTFGVDAEGDSNELKALGKLINGKKTPEIFALADQVAQKNGIAWSASGPPSLGAMNIFGSDSVKESDSNDVVANSLSIRTKPVSIDSISGPKSLQVIPRLVDNNNNPIAFVGAGLETILEVFSNGTRILTSKNLMQDNNFKGFNIRFASLPAGKIVDNKIDISVSVKTKNKTYKMTKMGVAINPNALLIPAISTETPENITPENTNPQTQTATNNPENTTVSVAKNDPKTAVTKFLNNLNSQNLRAAYDSSENANWGSYETFSNPTSGFGAVKNIRVKNISNATATGNTSTVNATYDVTDKTGKTTSLLVTFGLKNVNGDWKISNYKIN